MRRIGMSSKGSSQVLQETPSSQCCIQPQVVTEFVKCFIDKVLYWDLTVWVKGLVALGSLV